VRVPKPPKRGRRAKRPLGAKRRAAKAAGWVDPDSWQDVLRFYRFGCAYCKADHWDQQDHCQPLSRGGKHEIGNVVPACAACNYRKGTRTAWPTMRHPFMAPL
jgi:5-methylcytosine-specific restriction endonuclease McrA